MSHFERRTAPAAAHGREPAPVDPVPRRKWLALTMICLAQFMLIADITVVNVALPTIGRALDLRGGDLTWAVAAYSVCFGGLMILGGKLADTFGRRRMLLTGLVLFVAASALSGLAGGAGALIGGRAAQGVGAALMSPAALSQVTTMFTGRDRTRAIGIWSAIGGAGAALGVLLGGVLTSYASWRWIFFVNVPAGIAVLTALPLLLPRTDTPARRRVDLAGALAVTATAALLVFGFVRAGDVGWAAPQSLGALVLGGVAAAVFVLIERSTQKHGGEPLMRLEILARRPVLTGLALMLTASSLLLAGFFLSSLYLQQVLHFTPVRTGLLFLPCALAIGLGVHVGTRTARSVGIRPTATTGFLVAATGAALLTRLDADSDAWPHLLPGLFLLTLGIGALLVSATTTALAGAEHAIAGTVSGIVNSGHELGSAIGVALVTALAGTSVTGPTTGGSWPTGGFSTAFTVCAALAALAAPVCQWAIPRGRADADSALPSH
ncbi:MFS transporter [Streptomyces sp. NPDC058459]|uniref:MFS transporter n=1 Tax=Streptomyces sp. NPDC058459 TaxID=3346508 RepID=UPI00365A54F8